MTITEMHQSFRFGLDKMDALNYPNFLPEEIDLLLNQAQDRITKQRYGITNTKRTSFEETQKRTEDLKDLIRNVVLTPTANSGIVGLGDNITTNSVFVTLPTDEWFIIQERVIIHSDTCNTETFTIQVPAEDVEQCRGCPPCDLAECVGDTVFVVIPAYNITVTGKYAEVRPIQHLEFDKVINDAFKAPDYDKVLRLMYDGKVEIVPGPNSTVTRYLLRYIKKPLPMSISSTPPTNCELAEYMHQEIVDSAIVIALEGIEAKRNNTFTPLIDNTKE